MDLDSVIAFINENIDALTLKDEKHAECINSKELHGHIKSLIAQRNQTNAYASAIITDLKNDKYLTWDISGHVQRGVEMFHFNIETNGYLAKHEEDKRRVEEERKMREAEYGANISAVVSAGRADKRAKMANIAAMVSALCAIFTIAFPSFYTSPNSADQSDDPQNGGEHVQSLGVPPASFVVVHDSLSLDSVKSK